MAKDKLAVQSVVSALVLAIITYVLLTNDTIEDFYIILAIIAIWFQGISMGMAIQKNKKEEYTPDPFREDTGPK